MSKRSVSRIIQIVPILIYILIMLCISLYHIGNGGNKLFVFVFVFVYGGREVKDGTRKVSGMYIFEANLARK